MARSLPALLALALAGAAWAEPTVRATGAAQGEFLPDTARIHTVVIEKGPNLQAAMAVVTQRAAAVEKGLKSLSPQRVTLETPRVTSAPATQNAKLARAVKRLKVLKGGGGDEQVTISVRIVGEWALAGADASAQVVQATELSRKVASVSRSAHTTEGEAEHDEEEAEGAEMAPMYGPGAVPPLPGNVAAAPGAVALQYVKRLTPALSEPLVAEALKQAKENARRLAEQAGHDLGALQAITSNTTGVGDEEEGPRGYLALLRTGPGGAAPPQWELASLFLAPLKVVATVDTTWQMKPR